METKLIVLLKYLPQLQEQGVMAIEVDGIKVHLRGMPQASSAPAPEPPAGRDPITLGLPPGTKLPTLRERRGT